MESGDHRSVSPRRTRTRQASPPPVVSSCQPASRAESSGSHFAVVEGMWHASASTGAYTHPSVPLAPSRSRPLPQTNEERHPHLEIAILANCAPKTYVRPPPPIDADIFDRPAWSNLKKPVRFVVPNPDHIGHFVSCLIPLVQVPTTVVHRSIPTPLYPDGTSLEVAHTAGRKKFYIVKVGFRVGVYDTWSNCAERAVVAGTQESLLKVAKSYQNAVADFQRAVWDDKVRMLPCRVELIG
jgi:hypothetical protein